MIKTIILAINSPKEKDLTKLIYESLQIKKSFIEDHEFDLGKRSLLNYGHTLGHALEVQSNYRIPHGIAVTAGMIYANILSRERRILDDDSFELINNQLLVPNLKVFNFKKSYFQKNGLLAKALGDKKRISSNLAFILLDKNLKAGKANDITFPEFTNALSILKSIIKDKIN